MDKLFLDKDGRAIELEGDDKRVAIRFPVCLSVSYGGSTEESCADFILNISKVGVFVLTREPLEKGTRLNMRFYIPPEKTVLSVFEGVVVDVNRENPAFPRGMHIKFAGAKPEDLMRLEAFLEGRKHLVDTSA